MCENELISYVYIYIYIYTADRDTACSADYTDRNMTQYASWCRLQQNNQASLIIYFIP